MKKFLFLSLMVLAAGPLLAADASPKDTVTAAAAALGGQKNYSWRMTVEVPADSPFKPGPTDGKTENGGYTTLSTSFNDNTMKIVLKGTNVAVNTPDNGWQSAAEALADNGGGGFNPATFMVRMAQSYKVPAAEAASLAGQAQDLKADTNGISGDLTEAGAKVLLTFRRGGGGGGPTITNPKGSVTFWVTDGSLTKYQYHVTGTVSFNGNDRDVDRTTTIEIKDVNTTTVEVADDAKKKLE